MIFTDNSRQSDEAMNQRFWAKVRKTATCWFWTGYRYKNGYGYVRRNSKSRLVHRVAYELTNGTIPAEMTVDHTCHTTACKGGDTCPHRPCVNPAHLEAVSFQTNVLRGVGPTAQNARRTHCKRGHTLSEENVYRYRGWRNCRICTLAKVQRRYRRLHPRRVA